MTTVCAQCPLVRRLVPGAVEMLDTVEAARLLHVHPETIRRWHREGRIRSCGRAGRKILFKRDDLVHWLEGPKEI